MCESNLFFGVVFYGFSTCGCYLGHDFIILGVQTYHLTGLVPPFSFPEDHFVSLRTPERTIEGHMGAQNQMTESTPRVIGVAGRKR